jgi:hypothetical protein
MIQEDSYKIKFDKLKPWAALIFHPIKKELRNEHLLKTPAFAQKHFPKRALDKLTSEEFAAAYLSEIAEGSEEVGENVVTRWMMKNGEVYQLFATELTKINPKFDEIESLPADVSALLLNTAVAQFGASATYIFSIMNAVVLNEEQLNKLREMALLEISNQAVNQDVQGFKSVEEATQHYEKAISKLTEKLEKRLQGVERKYNQDVDGFKKQIAQLHRKLVEKGVGA